MTADERIEKLLNCFGQTISDLPKSGRLFVYNRDSRSNAEYQVFAFAGESGHANILDCLAMHEDYICHLTDVIDRMEVALETAKLTMDCKLCQTRFSVCQEDCETHAKVTDWLLSGMYKSDFEEFMKNDGIGDN